jgi:hypothetical protein
MVKQEVISLVGKKQVTQKLSTDELREYMYENLEKFFKEKVKSYPYIQLVLHEVIQAKALRPSR